jgi:phosphoesterase RecJ-like protein
MTTTKIRTEIVRRLRQGGRALISSHLSPDGDSIGSQLALFDLAAQLGCQPMIINHDGCSRKYGFLRKYPLINVFDDGRDYPQFDLALLLESPDIDRIGDVARLVEKIPFLINIDHHPANAQYGAVNYIDESEAAAAILIYELFREAEVALSLDNAEEIYTGIVSDTGRFRFSNTSARAMRICADLIERGVSSKRIADALYANFPEEQVRLMGELTAGMEIYHDGRTCFLTCDRPLYEKYPQEACEMEGLVDYSLYTSGVCVGALLRELGTNRIKVSLRSQDRFDVAELARIYGGGGHRNAAGCFVFKPLREVKRELLSRIEARLPS